MLLIWKSTRQHFKNGRRISKALYEEILNRATKRGEAEHTTHKRRAVIHIKGMTGDAYRWESKAGKVDWSEVLLRAGDTEAPEPMKRSELINLAKVAKPIDEADYGSERQTDAQNHFFDVVESLLSGPAFADIEAYSMKATTEEMIDYALPVALVALVVKSISDAIVAKLPEGHRAVFDAGEVGHTDDVIEVYNGEADTGYYVQMAELGHAAYIWNIDGTAATFFDEFTLLTDDAPERIANRLLEVMTTGL